MVEIPCHHRRTDNDLSLKNCDYLAAWTSVYFYMCDIFVKGTLVGLVILPGLALRLTSIVSA